MAETERLEVGNVIIKALDDLRLLRERLHQGDNSDQGKGDDIQGALQQAERGLTQHAAVIAKKVLESGSRRQLDMQHAHSHSLSGPVATVTLKTAPLSWKRKEAARNLEVPPEEMLRRMLHLNQEQQDCLTDSSGHPLPSKSSMEKLGEEGQVLPLGVRMGGRAVILPKHLRDDPTSFPPLSVLDVEVGKGLMHLVNAGILPACTDITPSLVGDAGVLKARAVRLLEYSAQFDRLPPGTQADDVLKRGTGWRFNPTTPSSCRRKAATEAELCDSRCAGKLAVARLEMAAAALPSEGAVENVRMLSPAPRASGEIRPEQVEAAREYERLMDDHSLHEVYVRKGVILDTLPEFVSFHRTNRRNWLAIARLLMQIEHICAQYNVPLAVVDGKALAALATYSPEGGSDAKIKDLLACVKNIQDVAAVMRIPGRFFLGPSGTQAAAVVIQKHARGFLARRWYEENSNKARSVRSIQRVWRVHNLRRQRRAAAAAAREAAQQVFVALQERLRSEWPILLAGHHVIIHVPAINLPPWQRDATGAWLLQAKESAQMARLCDVSNPNADVLFVAPNPVDDVVLGYWQKLLEVGGVSGASSRFRIVVPENALRLPTHMSLTAKLLASPQAMKRIKLFLRGRAAFIVPGVASQADVDLAVQLGVPLLAPHPDLSRMLCRKSSARQLFSESRVHVAPGMHLLPHALQMQLLQQQRQQRQQQQQQQQQQQLAQDDPAAVPELGNMEFCFDGDGQLVISDTCASRAATAAPASAPTPQRLVRKDKFLATAMASMMVAHPDVQRWLVKLDEEDESRGHAYVDMDGLPSVTMELERLHAPPAGCSRQELEEEAEERIAHLLLEYLPKSLHIVCPEVFAGYRRYVEALRQQGGVLEACASGVTGSPSINMFIGPTGDIRVVSTQEQIFCPAYRPIGFSFPQSSVPHVALYDAATTIGRACYEAGIFGHISIDFVTCRVAGQLRLWAVDLDLHYAPSLTAFQLFDFLSTGDFNPSRGTYTVMVDYGSTLDSALHGDCTPAAREAAPGADAATDKNLPDSLAQAQEDTTIVSKGGNDDVRWTYSLTVEPSLSWGLGEQSGCSTGGSGDLQEETPVLVPQLRYFVTCDLLHHPRFRELQYASFFQQCRTRGFCFDLRDRLGLAFNVAGGLGGGMLGLLCSACSPLEAFDGLDNCLWFLWQLLEGGAHNLHAPGRPHAPSAVLPDQPRGQLPVPLKSAVDTIHFLAERFH